MKYILDFFNVFTKAAMIRSDEEKRPKSARFAVTCIIFSIIMAACAIAGGLLLPNESIVITIFAVILLVCAAVELTGAAVRLIAQFTINRSVMSWVALAVFLTAIICSVVTVIIL